MSRVAIMTGLTRREVARLRKVAEHDLPDLKSENTVAGKVLAAWHQEPEYLDELEQPKPLRIEGDNSLSSLIDRFRTDIPNTALIKELIRVKAIMVRGNYARVQTRYYMPFALDARSIERFGSVLRDIAHTITHNLFTKDTALARFEGRATNERISSHAYDAFTNYLDRKAQVFLEEVDDWLKDHEVESENETAMRLGIGVYAIANGDAKDEF